MNIESTVVAIVAILTMVAAGAALFVSMKVSGALNQFRVDFMKELDERYVRRNEHNQEAAASLKEEEHYRTYTGERLKGLEVQVFKDRDDVNIVLRNILLAIQEKKD